MIFLLLHLKIVSSIIPTHLNIHSVHIFQEKQEWACIEGDIEALENRIVEIEEEMQANGSDFGKLATLQKELDEKNEALLEKYERYEYLSELV